MHQISIDCGPGSPRPSTLLPSVLEGLGLPTPRLVSKNFGEFTWEIEADDALWKVAVTSLEKRLTDLYNQGKIRFAKWN
jgi:hypothetical protein